jgi:hypothetical protein
MERKKNTGEKKACQYPSCRWATTVAVDWLTDWQVAQRTDKTDRHSNVAEGGNKDETGGAHSPRCSRGHAHPQARPASTGGLPRRA